MPTLEDFTLASARRVHVVASVLMTVVVIVAAVGLAGGVAFAIVHHGHLRVEGYVIAAASVLSALFAALPYLIAQLLARYVKYRVTRDA